MKTILHFIDTTGPGGAESVFLSLVDKLQVQGYRNFALIKGSGWVEQQLQKRGIEYYIRKPSGFLSVPYYMEIIRLCRDKQVTLIQAHLLGAILTSSIISLICHIPLVATMHGQVDINTREKFIFFKNWLMATAVNRLIAVSSSLGEYIKKRGIFKKNKIDIIYNGVDTTKYSLLKNGEIRKKLHISNDSIIVGSLGNVRPAKNYNLLIEAAAILRQSYNKEIHFLIAGHQRSDLMNSLTSLAIEKNVSSIIHFLGFIDDTPKFLSELDLFLLSSSSEGFSIATIEAMAAGVPVIATRCGGPEEIITDNVDGILIKPNEPQEIVDNIIALSDDKKRRETLVAAALKNVQNKFSIGSMLEKYTTLYMQILSKQYRTLNIKGK